MSKLIYIIVLTLSIGTYSCNLFTEPIREEAKDMDYEVHYYSGGKEQSISDEKSMQVYKSVNNCFIDITEHLRVYIDDERVEEMLNTEKLWEINYKGSIDVQIGTFGQLKINRVIIPFSGDFAPSNKGKSITILTQSDGSWATWLCHVKESNRFEIE